MDETFPDLGSLTDVELKDVIRQLTEEETEISYKRRILHGKIDILRAELVNRLRKKHEGGEITITGDDVQQLTDILANRQPEDSARAAAWPCTAPSAASSTAREPTTASAAARCSYARRQRGRGAARRGGEPVTATYRIDETGELVPVEIERGHGARARRSSSAPAAGASGRASRSTASA